MNLNKEYLKKTFSETGLTEGDIVCVHSSLKNIGYIDGGPEAFIEALTETIGQEGTIVMPAFTYSFLKDEMKTEPFDAATTPSQTGLITEVFRKLPDTYRSVHPTHSVSVWGKRAEYFTAGHFLTSALGINSPLHKISAAGGKILLVGVGFEKCSHIHVAEILADLYYKDIFCWEYLGWKPEALIRRSDTTVEKIKLSEVPGCSANFKAVNSLTKVKNLIKFFYIGNAGTILVNAAALLEIVVDKCREYPDFLLCEDKSCPVCSFRKNRKGAYNPNKIREKQLT